MVMSTLLFIPLGDIMSNRYNVRKIRTDAYVKELADDIKRRGLINPITVREILEQDKTYEVAQGETRLHAFKLLAKKNKEEYGEIPAFVKKFKTETEFLSYAIAENVKRKNLTWLELGEALIELKGVFTLKERKPKGGRPKEWKGIPELIGLASGYVTTLAGVVSRLEPETREAIYSTRKHVKREGAYEIISWNNTQRILSKTKDDEKANQLIRDIIEYIVKHDLDFDNAYPLVLASSEEEEVERLVAAAKEYKVPLIEIAKGAQEVGVEKAVTTARRASEYPADFKEEPDYDFWLAVEQEKTERLSDVKRSVMGVEEHQPKKLSKAMIDSFKRMRPLEADESVKKYLERKDAHENEEAFTILYNYEVWRRRNLLKIEGKEEW